MEQTDSTKREGSRTPASVRWAAGTTIAVFVLLLMEITSLVAVSLLKKRARLLVYLEEVIPEDKYRSYLELRDPRLGWPSPSLFVGEKFDAAGARPSLVFPEQGGECLTLYGDSFTYGAEVEHSEAWAEPLSQKLGCRVANYGVSGYGTDQAYLRFEHNEADEAPVTILGFFAKDVTRNVTRYLYLSTGHHHVHGFKPRFIVEGEELKLIALPRIEPSDLAAFARSPERFLDHETFCPNTSMGAARMRFPYSLSLLRIVSSERIRNRIRRLPSWFNYLNPGHPSRGLEITVGIMEKFKDLCEERGKRCFVVLFPTPKSYDLYRRQGELAFQELSNSLTRSGVEYLDLTPGFAEYLGERSFCEIVTDGCLGHHNAEGNRVVMELVHDYMSKWGILASLR